jgi:hypothetical protein
MAGDTVPSISVRRHNSEKRYLIERNCMDESPKRMPGKN